MTETEIQQYLDSLAKPPGSLGRLEQLAAELARIQQSLQPRTHPRRCVIFAADHGVVAAGVSAWRSAVTAAVVQAIAQGRAACNALARTTHTELRLVDVGLLTPLVPTQPWQRVATVRRGTRNLAHEPALTVAEFDTAWQIGASEAEQAAAEGMAIVAAGEVGIGNTTAASCLSRRLVDLPLHEAVGRGAGADDAVLARKFAVVSAAVAATAGQPLRAALAALAGLEIAAMAGFYATAAARGLTIVLDGFVATTAALIAQTLHPGTARAFIAAHQSAEPGHRHILRHLQLQPMLDTWQMRLGEGTGALLLMPLLDAAAAMLSGMATLAELSPERVSGLG